VAATGSENSEVSALAYCVDCRNPLLATEYGFQFCPYERAGQHAKVSRARNPHQVTAGRARARGAARDTAGRFSPKGELPVPIVTLVRTGS
jgi:hypothetical protein